MDQEVRAALSRSHLCQLAEPEVEALLEGAVRDHVPAGRITHREGEPAPHVDLVVSGLLRVFVAAPDGRTMTVRYCRSGALIGVISLFTDGFRMPASTQVVVDADVLKLSPRVVRRTADTDPKVAGVLLRELSDRAVSLLHEIPGSTFTTVRQRVARHLLDLASQEAADRSSELVVTVSQRSVAEAVGTVREVVVRVLRELRQEGVVRTERDQIVIVDAARLAAEHEWNPGS